MPENKNSTCGVVVDYVMDLVAKREFNVGDKLPPERDLAKRLNVSRPTVREAIKVLNYLGFVDSTQGSGNYIADTYGKTTANIMKVMYLRRDVDFDGFTVFRQMLELQSFELAMDNISGAQLSEMQQIVKLLDVTKDVELITGLDSRLHMLMAEASANPLILINFQAILSIVDEYMHDTYFKTVSKKTDGFMKLQEYHHAIVDALANKDREAGMEAIRNHFLWIV